MSDEQTPAPATRAAKCCTKCGAHHVEERCPACCGYDVSQLPSPLDPRLRWAVLNQLARMAAQPCECAARMERHKLPEGAPFRIDKLEWVKCVPCRAAEALVREIRGGK